MSGIIHDVSSTGATVFVEPQAVVEANARILQYRAQEAQEIERILVAFTGQVAAIEPQFQYSYKAMLEIDVLLAKARLALDMKAFKPAVRTDTSFSHPGASSAHRRKEVRSCRYFAGQGI